MLKRIVAIIRQRFFLTLLELYEYYVFLIKNRFLLRGLKETFVSLSEMMPYLSASLLVSDVMVIAIVWNLIHINDCQIGAIHSISSSIKPTCKNDQLMNPPPDTINV